MNKIIEKTQAVNGVHYAIVFSDSCTIFSKGDYIVYRGNGLKYMSSVGVYPTLQEAQTEYERYIK